jgi:DNA repair protein RadC
MKIYEATIQYNAVGNISSHCCNNPEAIVQYMEGAFEKHPQQEQFFVILLNRKNKPMGRIGISLGTVSTTLVHPMEVFRPAILSGASAIICVHNHPSGDPAPSIADIRVTQQIKEAGSIMSIQLLDHVIIGQKDEDAYHKGYYSFAEAGLL